MGLERSIKDNLIYGMKGKFTDGKKYSEEEINKALAEIGFDLTPVKVGLIHKKEISPLDIAYSANTGVAIHKVSFEPVVGEPGYRTFRYKQDQMKF